jgi:predicted nuclease of predicted toxin-antitoxin system
MKFLVNENLGCTLVDRLKELGHEVAWVGTVMRGAEDEEVLKAARRQGRIIITEDKDFGDLVYRRKLKHRGIILLRLRKSMPREIIRVVAGLIERFGEDLESSFVVAREEGIRIKS